MPQSATIDDLDSQLLAARDLREQKRGSPVSPLNRPLSSVQAKSEEKDRTEDETEANEEPSSAKASEGEPKSLRERVMAARQALNLKETAKQKLEEKVMAPAKQGTSRLLKMAWLNIIDSFGLTLIWVNIHVFLRWVVGDKLFCRLGEEWLPAQAAQVGGQEAETASKGVGLIETIVLLIVDFIILMSILANLVLIVMIVDFMQSSWWEKFKLFIGALTKLSWAAIKSLMQLF